MSNVPGQRPGRESEGSPAPFIVAGILVVIAIVLPLWVPMYAKDEPRLWGFPFFFWYQLLWVFLAAICVSIAYRLVTREEQRRRAARAERAERERSAR